MTQTRHDALRRSLHVGAKLLEQGAIAAPSTPEQPDAIVRRDPRQWQAVITAARVQPD